MNDLRAEDILFQVREKLNEEQIKLWLPPYYIENNGSSDKEMEGLAKSFTNSLSIDETSCLTALRTLQTRALERLQEREKYKETGVATLKVRVPNPTTRTTQLSIHIKLSLLGRELQEAVAKEINETPDRVKLIWNGKVLNSKVPLGAQNVKHGTQLMAIIIHDNSRDLQENEANHQLIEATKAAAKLLADSSNDDLPTDDNYTLQIADQTGKPLNLPPEEKRALLVAMSLHEKGRAALKAEKYPLALLLFLEADKEFSHCNSRILHTVDNYALLNLDIAWCYLCLRSVSHLPDAEERLKKCETSFHRSYGPNLERVMALKGTTGNEAALFMRLHLLQGIVLFHQNKRQAAARLFTLAETELGNLKVDDSNVCQLLELGYSPAEARISLRATHGDINAAVELINRRRKEREDFRKKEEAEYKLNKQRRILGKCVDGQWVEPQLHQLLLSMGFDSGISCCALQATNNNVEMSIQLIQEQPHLLKLRHVSKTSIDKITTLGFDRKMAKRALSKCYGDVEKAVETLLRSSTSTDPNDSLQDCDNGDDDDDDDDNNDEDEDSCNSHLQREREREREKEKERAYRRIAEGLSHEEDHLDFTLIHEEIFLNEYKALLNVSDSHC